MLRWRFRIRNNSEIHMVSDEADTRFERGYLPPESLPAYVLERAAVLQLMPTPTLHWTELPGIGKRAAMGPGTLPQLGDIYYIDDAGHEDGQL